MNEKERHEIEALLPWHAAGTLSRCDVDRVEQALSDDPELARHYDLVRQELAETIHLNERSLAEPAWYSAGRSTGDHPSLASCGFHGVLALEIAEAGRAAKD
jgi:hypothetical protein